MRSLGFPFPSSRRIFSLLGSAYYRSWQRQRDVEAEFDRIEPGVLVLSHIQNSSVIPYVLAARARGVPILGMVGSWDQPTTKGPVCPGIDVFLSQSRAVAEELVRYHSIDPDAVRVIGWPQMDVYRREGLIPSRSAFLSSLGIPDHHRLVVFGTNARRIGAHEPALAEFLARCSEQGTFGDCTIILRPHPNDPDWAARFVNLHDPPNVIVEGPELGDLPHLAALMSHGDVVLSTGGSIALDAVAFDTPAIAIGFSDLDVPFAERPERLYEMEHNKEVVETGGVLLTRDRTGLVRAIQTYLSEPRRDSEGRQRLRDRYLEPLDGMASDRLVDTVMIAASARRLEAAPNEAT